MMMRMGQDLQSAPTVQQSPKMSEMAEETIKHYKKRLIQQHDTRKQDNRPFVIEKINPKTLSSIPVKDSLRDSASAVQKDSRKADASPPVPEVVLPHPGDESHNKGEAALNLRKRRFGRIMHDNMEFIKLGNSNASNTLCKTSVGRTIIKSNEPKPPKQIEQTARHHMPQIVEKPPLNAPPKPYIPEPTTALKQDSYSAPPQTMTSQIMYAPRFPMTPEPSPTHPNQFLFSPRGYVPMRPVLPTPIPPKPLPESVHVKRPRGRPRLHNNGPIVKKPTFNLSKPNTLVDYSHVMYQPSFLSPPGTPQEPTRLRFSNNFGGAEILQRINKKAEVVEISDTEESTEKRKEQELNNIIQLSRRIGFTPESFNRLRSIYCDLEQTVQLDRDQYLNEAYTSIIKFNSTLVEAVQNTFFMYCDDNLVKQVLPLCGKFFPSFIDKLLNKKSSGSWSFLVEIRIVEMLQKVQDNVAILQEQCKKQPDYMKQHFRVDLLSQPKVNDDILFSVTQPSVMIMVDKYGNYLKCIHQRKLLTEAKFLEVIVLNESCTQERLKQKERLSVSSTEDTDKMSERISTIIDNLDGDVIDLDSESANTGVEDISDDEQPQLKVLPLEQLTKKHKLPVLYTHDAHNTPIGPNTSLVRSLLTKDQSVQGKLPRGKLCYLRPQHMLLRYFDTAQAHMFRESLDNGHVPTDSQNEAIKLPAHVRFSDKEILDQATEYLSEYALVEQHVPADFFAYYKYVTGYQIYRGNIPISFQTFLTMHNTNGLKVLMASYIEQIGRQDKRP